LRTERLLDDTLAEVPLVWSPDSSKVATSFGVDVGIYDAGGKAPTQARILLRERLLGASAAFDENLKPAKKPTPETSKQKTPAINPLRRQRRCFSFNPIVRVEWPAPEKLYLETVYVSVRSD